MRLRSLVVVALTVGACGDEREAASDVTATTDAAPTSDAASEVADTTSPGEDTIPTEVATDVATDATTADVRPSTEPIDDDVVPCDEPRYWPYSVASEAWPIRVHYRTPAEEAIALDVVEYADQALDVMVDDLGFRAPLPDAVRCGPDARLDIFLWRGTSSVYTDVLGSNPATSWDDAPVYIVLDTDGFTAGEWLDATVAHELNHAIQAAYDWTDTTIIYEASSTFIEDVVHDDDDNYQYLMGDFQQNPDWSIDRDDGYETWFMYGFALYLHYLNERFFEGDPRFLVRMWEGLQSPEWAGEPDFEDALDELLADHGRSFLDTVLEFQRWRWYVGERDDGRHLEEAGAFPEDATVAVEATVQAGVASSTTLRPMMLGTMFVDVVGDAGDAIVVTLDRTGGASTNNVHWVVQALPGVGGDDGETVDIDAGTPVALVDGRRTLVVTAMPGTATNEDPDARTDQRFRVTLEVEPAP